MEKLINSAFDFFAYALPGGFILLASFLLDERFDTLQDFLNFAQNLKLGGFAVLICAGYLIGFAITPLGRILYRKYQQGRFFRDMNTWLEGSLKKEVYEFDDDAQPEKRMPISEKFVLVRELSPLNFRYIESWHVYSLMSHNMAVANMLVMIFIGIRLVVHPPAAFLPWILFLVGGLIFTFLFLYSAAKFFIWSTNEQNAAIEALHLPQLAQKKIEQEPKP